MVTVVWFKRDLRLADHAALARAAARGPVLPLYVFEPGLWAQPDVSGRQFEFLRESVEDLALALRAAGVALVVRVGRVTDVLRDLQTETRFDRMLSHEETGNGWTYARDCRLGIGAVPTVSRGKN